MEGWGEARRKVGVFLHVRKMRKHITRQLIALHRLWRKDIKVKAMAECLCDTIHVVYNNKKQKIIKG